MNLIPSLPIQQPEPDNRDAFNLNSPVWVNLTERGERVLTEYINEAATRLTGRGEDSDYWKKSYRKEHPCIDGHTEMQGWQMIKIFGPHLSIGSGLFSMNIRLKAPIARKEDE